MLRANQHVLAGLQVLADPRQAPALSHAAIVRHGTPWRSTLAVASVEQDLDAIHVFELLHQGAPQVPLIPRDHDQAAHRATVGRPVFRHDSIPHAHL
jgi:hypothetical protein